MVEIRRAKIDDETFLDYLYIKTDYIGQGYGRLLWKHMIKCCKRLGIKRLELIAAPVVEEFYLKMGAKRISEINSPILNGRIISKLEYIISF